MNCAEAVCNFFLLRAALAFESIQAGCFTVHNSSLLAAVHMVNAVVLLQIERGLINETAQGLAELKGVSEVYSVAGQYDLVVIIRVPNNDALAKLVTEEMHQFEGIMNSETLIAFRAYSQHDLESMFSIGME